MIISLNGLGYELSEAFRSTYKVSDDVDIRLFKQWAEEMRSTLVKQRLDDNVALVDETLVQDLGAVAFAPVDSSVHTVLSGKYLMRSTNSIPLTINRKGNIGTFTRIAPADRLERKLNLVPYERALISGNGKFNQNDIFVFLDGNYLNLISKTNIHKLISRIHIKGVFVSPKDAYEFRYGTGTWTDDMPYPISSTLIADLMTMVKDKNFKYIMTPLEDRNSNGTDDVVNLTNKK